VRECSAAEKRNVQQMVCGTRTIKMMDYRHRIEESKKRLPLPKLMKLQGDADAAFKIAPCPFHDDENPSFSVWRSGRGQWFWKCHAGCGQGDEIDYLAMKLGMEKGEAIKEFLQLAGLWWINKTEV